MKAKLLLAIVSVLIVGCQSTRYQVSEPTASPENIKEVQERFSDVRDMKVTDDGVVEYSRWVPSRHRWSTVHTQKSAYEYSCIEALSLLKAGFTVSIHFKGAGGNKYDYDLERCNAKAAEQESKTESK